MRLSVEASVKLAWHMAPDEIRMQVMTRRDDEAFPNMVGL